MTDNTDKREPRGHDASPLADGAASLRLTTLAPREAGGTEDSDPARFLVMSDEDYAKASLGWFMAIHAERHGLDVRKAADIPPEFAESVRISVAASETDGVEDMAWVKALSLAAAGQWDRAGKLLRQFVVNAAKTTRQQELAQLGGKVRKQRRKYSEQGNATKKAAAKKDRSEWLKVGEPLRRDYPTRSDSWLAQKISALTGANASTIRAALGELGLKKKPAGTLPVPAT